MSSKVAIIGVAATAKPGLNMVEKSFKEMVVDVSYDAIKDAGIDPLLIDGASYSYTGEGELGYGGIAPTLTDALGLSPIPSYVNSANCSSASVAFTEGCKMIESGEHKVVLVCGFDKQTDIIPFENYILVSTDSMYDHNLGVSHLDAAFLSMEYFRDNNISDLKKKQSLLYFAQLMRKNAHYNPIATLYGQPVPTIEQLEKMPMFGSVMSAGEGAAAVILADEETAEKYCKNPIYVKGKGFATGSHYFGHRYHPDLINTEYDYPEINNIGVGFPLEIACKDAYKQAGITPQDLDVIELYDQGLNQYVSMEAIGICEKGKAIDFTLEGNVDPDGKIPVNTDGGNIGRGHVAGAGGLYQIIEITKQLQHRAEGIQIKNKCKYGLSTVVGGCYAHSVAIVLSSEK